MLRILYFLCSFCLLSIVMGTQCEKDWEYPAPEHFFKEKVQVTPVKKVYNVGETIWISFNTPDKTLFDTISNKRVATSGLNFQFWAFLVPKYQTPVNPPDGYCSFILPTGVSANTRTSEVGTGTSFVVGCDNANNYDTKIGVVLNHKGTYLFDMTSISIVEKCDAPNRWHSSPNLRFIFDIADTNKDVFLSIPVQSRNEYRAGITETWLDAKVAFAIKVE